MKKNLYHKSRVFDSITQHQPVKNTQFIRKDFSS